MICMSQAEKKTADVAFAGALRTPAVDNELKRRLAVYGVVLGELRASGDCSSSQTTFRKVAKNKRSRKQWGGTHGNTGKTACLRKFTGLA